MRALLVVRLCAIIATSQSMHGSSFRFMETYLTPLTVSEIESPQSVSSKEGSENAAEKLFRQMLRSQAKAKSDCKRRAAEATKALAEPIPTEEQLFQKCLAEAKSDVAQVPFTHKARVETELQRACREAAHEELNALLKTREKNKKAVGTCEDVMERVRSEAERNVEESRKLEASAIGYDLTTLEEHMSTEKATRLRAAYAEVQGCEHDYSVLCPFSWESTTNDYMTCKAPPAYVGPCDKIQSFAVSAEEKQQKERDCLIGWPCLRKCKRDFRALCPLDWVEIGGGYCTAPASYSGRCARKENFASQSEAEKERWSASCNAYWPCAAECKRDYAASCPVGWTVTEEEGRCRAPAAYAGPCGPIESIGSMDASTKALFENRCNVLFPCEEKCEKDYMAMCPERWNNIALEKCAPSEDYAGPCKDEVDFAGKTEEEKVSFESLCLVKWPCVRKQDCSRDFTETCPLEWKQIDTTCRAPASYTGPCGETQNFVTLTPKERIAASETCAVFWPCKGGDLLLRDMLRTGMAPMPKPHIEGPTAGPIDPESGRVKATYLD